MIWMSTSNKHCEYNFHLLSVSVYFFITNAVQMSLSTLPKYNHRIWTKKSGNKSSNRQKPTSNSKWDNDVDDQCLYTVLCMYGRMVVGTHQSSLVTQHCLLVYAHALYSTILDTNTAQFRASYQTERIFPLFPNMWNRNLKKKCCKMTNTTTT